MPLKIFIANWQLLCKQSSILQHCCSNSIDLGTRPCKILHIISTSPHNCCALFDGIKC